MAESLEALAAKGYENYARKAATMKASYAASRGRMATGYGAQNFGPIRKSNYNAALDAMVSHYRTDAEKWRTNWVAKMRE